MYRRLLFILCLLAAVNGHTQVLTQTIRGRVIDADSKSPVIGAGVLLQSTDIPGTSTDADGKFRIEKVPVGRHSLRVTSLGYEDAFLNNIVVGSGKEVVLTIELREKAFTADEVEIVYEKDKTKANNDLVTLSARNFQSEETERYAGSRGDPSKMVANYAGVATGNDARNDIIVRGNSPLGVLWRLEGVDIPNPNHFSTQGATGGPVSMLNNNLLGNSDFLTGAFPAEYGNKLAAVFDLKLRNGNNEKMEYTGQIGFNGLELGAEGPISKEKGSSFLVNYRYSTLEVFNLLGISFGVAALPKYQDASFKVNIPSAKKGIFTIWGIGGMSHLELLDSKRDSSEWSFTSKGEDLDFFSGMMATGVSHQYFFNSNTSGKLSLSYSASKFQVSVDTLSSDRIPFNVYTNRSIDGQVFANYTLTSKFNARNLIKSGITWKQLFFDYNSSYFSRTDQVYRDQLKENNSSGLAQAYAHWQFRVNENITLNNGLYYQLFTLNKTWALEPRLGMRWQFHPKQALTLGAGMHSQTQPLVYYSFKSFDYNTGQQVVTNRDLDLTRAIHYIAGYDLNFKEDFRLKLEAYYQTLYDVPVEANTSSSLSMLNAGANIEGIPLVDSLVNEGTGKNYGGEITIEKFFSKGYYFLLTTSVYESKYTGSDKIERHTAFSGGYVFNTLGGYEFKLGKDGNKLLALDAKFTLAGGNRYTPIDLSASIMEKNAVYIDELAWTKRFKDYQKLDVKVSFKLNKKRSTQLWFVSIENVLNHRNIFRQVFNEDQGAVVEEYQLGLFPYGGYRIEF
jgi:hypothetical protein